MNTVVGCPSCREGWSDHKLLVRWIKQGKAKLGSKPVLDLGQDKQLTGLVFQGQLLLLKRPKIRCCFTPFQESEVVTLKYSLRVLLNFLLYLTNSLFLCSRACLPWGQCGTCG